MDGLTTEERYNLARDQGTALEVLAELLWDADRNVSDAAAWNPCTPLSALLDALNRGSDELRMTVLSNRAFPLDEAVKFIRTVEDSKVIQRFAYRQDLTPEVLIMLASHQNVIAAAGVGRNPNMPIEAGLLATVGRSERSLVTIFTHQRFPYPVFASWLTRRGVDFSVYDTPGSLPFQFFLDWLGECEDSKARYECVELVVKKRFADVRAYVETVTGASGLPEAWVVKMFRTLVGVV